MRVYVLLFNAGTDNEGIHTIRVSGSDGSEHNIVMMFASEDDATRYALLLEAQDFHAPTVEEFLDEEIQEFCASCGYEAKLIPAGFVPQSPEERVFLAPPEQNVGDTDWEREQREAEGAATAEPAEFQSSELDEIRRRLEGLL